jgi:hypothetical protein
MLDLATGNALENRNDPFTRHETRPSSHFKPAPLPHPLVDAGHSLAALDLSSYRPDDAALHGPRLPAATLSAHPCLRAHWSYLEHND